jgi:2-iminobutanoate/2-iminopropanoate deaminase
MRTVQTTGAPPAIGPYSQGVVAGGLVFVSGQVALDPATGALVPGGVAEQTEQVLRNVAAILEEAGSSLGRVVRTTVYLTSLSTFEEMNGVYARFFGAHRPARATVEVPALPKGAAVELEAVALAEEAP